MTDHNDSPLVLVDGSSYLYRAFFALPPLKTSTGQPTGAVRGVVSMLKRLQRDYPNSSIVVVFDAKGKTFRDELFEQYKAHRPSMPDEMREQIEPLHQCVKALGFPMIIHAGVEADDVIGTLAVKASKQQRQVIISTGDKDMAQLVNSDITLVNTMSNSAYDSEGVVEKFGVPPELIIDYLALIGDKSDNIPGVPGVGEKSAVPLLMGIGDMDAIYANLDKVASLEFRGAKKMGERLQEHRDQAYLSRLLATIKLDVELPEEFDTLENTAPDVEALVELYKALEFRNWLNELSKQADNSSEKRQSTKATKSEESGQQQLLAEERAPDQASSDEVDATASQSIKGEYETVLTQEQLDVWIEKLKQAPYFAFDTETTSLDYMEAEVVGVSFATQAGAAAYVPLTHQYLDVPDQLDREAVLAQLKPLLEDPSQRIVGQNLKYDMSVLANHGIALGSGGYDTMLESYVSNPVAGRHDMDSLAFRYLGRETIKFEEVAGKGAKQIRFDAVEIERATEYAAEDADITLQLHEALWPKIDAEPSLKQLFDEIEWPLIKVLSRIERNGALVDGSELGAQSQELAKELERLEREAHDEVGEPFNLNSPKQLQVILFEKMELPVVRKTAKGQPSTAEEVLQELAADYKLPQLILEYRGMSKLKSTYTDKLPTMINPKTGRIHTSYHQAVTATGRLSSSDPNLQNIPIRTEQGRRVRKAFIAAKGNKIVAADYSQIELRIMAHLSADQGLLKAFEAGLDIHSATAAEVFDVAIEDVTSDQRRSAKAINFGLIYGMSAFGLGRQLKIGRNEAQTYIDTYFARYPGVADYMERTRAMAHEKGFVETLCGRRLPLPEINDRNGMRRQAAERAAINAPMQGTAADIIKLAMISIDNWMQESKFEALMIMQVHDELVFEVPEAELEQFTAGITERMESALALAVPLLVEVGVADTWDAAH